MNNPDFFDAHDFSQEIQNAQPAEWEVSPMSAFTVRLPKQVLEALRDLARQRGVTTGQVMRDILTSAAEEGAKPEKMIPASELRALITRVP
ncbi:MULTISPECIES: CopG family transcriptional regulator [unclassified Corynebacterium]|uniref:CopG family transcriptional regulator n=1 Tax=unclassified Corynebacterium TaxID=2624378 RepID=UPI0029CA50EE|nr:MULTISPECIES: CopG family transcriptional regulator [unclassified Corynebacterium]WPF66344.1 CopG family transcriptional regulator [Corynebacterium sp. 22KM0430]WPF68834.1 CopG family transcriptional regulator [Corynebacterium sp. 21KM1197]